MSFVSVTRLRLRSIRFLPAFLLRASGVTKQIGRAAGFRTGSLLGDRRWTFWTLTLWDEEAAMRLFMLGGAHRKVMPSLARWCDEASVVHWEQPGDALPDWPEAAARMRGDGRPSRVLAPSPEHEAMRYAEPRLTNARPIAKA